MKVLYLVNIPSPYRVDFFNELGKKCELTVLFEKNKDLEREEKWFNSNFYNFKGVFLKNFKIFKEYFIAFEVLKYLKNNDYDLIVIGGYSTLTGMLAINYLKMKKIPFTLNTDGGFIKTDSKLKHMLKNYYIGSADKWLCSGKESKEYFKHYGAKEKDINIYPFTSIRENEIVSNVLSNKEKFALKEELGIKEKKMILSIGRFIPLKGFDVLINAAKSLDSDIGIYIIGGDPPEDYIRLKDEVGAKNINFIGFKSKTELSKYYRTSDLFVLPTRGDVWGLVINEAVANGLPVITTNKCIAGLEMIEDGVNGFITEVDNEKKLREKMNYILKNEEVSKEMTLSNLKLAKDYTIEKMADEHIKIFERVLKGGK